MSSIRRHHVVSTSMRRLFDVMCPLGIFGVEWMLCASWIECLKELVYISPNFVYGFEFLRVKFILFLCIL